MGNPMAAPKKAAAAAPAAKQGNGNGRGETVKLPTSIKSEPAQWPGSNRGAGSANAELRAQLASDVGEMALGDSRRYYIEGEKEQNAFIALFRKVTDEVWVDDATRQPAYGVQVSKDDGSLVVKLAKRVTRHRKHAETATAPASDEVAV